MVSHLRSQLASEFATGLTAPPTPRAPRMRRGRADLVFLADFAVALICFGATVGLLGSESAKAGHHYNGVELLLISFILCAPLVLRTRLPLTAWITSAAALSLTTILIAPHNIFSNATPSTE